MKTAFTKHQVRTSVQVSRGYTSTLLPAAVQGLWSLKTRQIAARRLPSQPTEAVRLAV
jgi:hypothetical protein